MNSLEGEQSYFTYLFSGTFECMESCIESCFGEKKLSQSDIDDLAKKTHDFK